MGERGDRRRCGSGSKTRGKEMRSGRGCAGRARSHWYGRDSCLDLPQSLLVRPFLSSVCFDKGEVITLRLLLLCKLHLALSFLELLLPSQLRSFDLLADLVGCLPALRWGVDAAGV